MRKGRGIYSHGEKTVRPKKLDERAPIPSHSLYMCHPHTEKWRSCAIMGEWISISWDAERFERQSRKLGKICFKVPFAISSADKDTVKILNEFQIERT